MHATVTTSGLLARWATPNQILWEWQLQGDTQRLLRYEIVLAESEADLASRAGTARVYDASTNPELAGATTRALTRGLEAGTTYYARVVAVDVSECGHPSEVVGEVTQQAA